MLSKLCPSCWKEYNENSEMNFCFRCGSPLSVEIANGFERSRATLLQTYSHQTITHGGYVIALIIGALTMISRWNDFSSNPLPFFIVLALVLGFGIYASSRAVFWAYLTGETSVVKISDLMYDDPLNTPIGRLQSEVLARFRNSSSWPLKDFVSDKAGWKNRVLLIMSPVFILFVFWVYYEISQFLFFHLL